MSETASLATAKSKMAGWLKALIASIFSAVSGAVLMYASPLLDMVIKPAKPVANFQAQVTGLKATFQNKSTGGHDGWWDFGDGSALEPFAADQLVVTHTYANTGDYVVKLSLKNLINEDNERSATVVIKDEAGPAPPAIEAFSIVPMHGDYAPATYKVEAKVKNANLCVWAVDNRPLVFSSEMANGDQSRLVSFNEPGQHLVKLAVYDGKQKPIEKIVQVVVNKAPLGLVTATVEVAYDAVQVEQRLTTPVIPMPFPADSKGSVITVAKPVAADVGFEFVKAELAPQAKNPLIKPLKVEIDSAEHGRALVTCELTRPKARTVGSSTVQVALTERRMSATMVKTPDPISFNLNTPGSTLVQLPVLPADWVVKARKINLTVQQDAKQYFFKDGKLPRNVAVQMSPNAEYLLDVVEQNGQLRIDLQAINKAWNMTGMSN